MDMSRTRFLLWIVTTVGATILTTWVSGLLMTDSRLKATIAEHPAIVTLQSEVKNLTDKVEANHVENIRVQEGVQQQLSNQNTTISRIAIVTGAEVYPPGVKKPPKATALPAHVIRDTGVRVAQAPR
jgi:hypothetical protein